MGGRCCGRWRCNCRRAHNSAAASAVTSERCNAGLRSYKLRDVPCYSQAVTRVGVRQMIGNVWEWTATTFYPFPGFVVDFPYREQVRICPCRALHARDFPHP